MQAGKLSIIAISDIRMTIGSKKFSYEKDLASLVKALYRIWLVERD